MASRAETFLVRFDEAFLNEADQPVNAMSIARKYLQKHKERSVMVLSQMVGKLKREGSKTLPEYEKALDIVKKQVKYSDRARNAPNKPDDIRNAEYKTHRYKRSDGKGTFEVTHWSKKKAAEGEV